MKILILGSEGFIGSHLVRHFLAGKNEVHGCDLIEYSSSGCIYNKLSLLSPDFEDVFSATSFDACINAAGSGNVGYSMQHPLSDFEANTYPVAKILNSINKHQPACKFIQISSAAVYGNPVSLPINEQQAANPVSAYGYHKQMSELLCREYHFVFGLPIAVMRPFSVYGRGLRKQLLWDTCCKLKDNNEALLFGTGNETRDYINIADFCTATELIILKGGFNCDVYNIANGKETSVKDLAAIFSSSFPREKKISFSGQVKKGDPLNWKADISKLTALGYVQKVRLEDGVKDYINWFLQQ